MFLLQCAKAKVGVGKEEHIAIIRSWEKDIKSTYADMCRLAVKLFTVESGLPLLTAPEGAFFCVISYALQIFGRGSQ